MSSRMRKPETVRVAISRGDSLVLKKYLTAGEHRAIFRRMMSNGATPARVDPLLVGVSRAAGYLVDWTITDDDDRPIEIRGLEPDAIMSVLDALELDDFREIVDAIEAHEAAMDRARADEKKTAGAIS